MTNVAESSKLVDGILRLRRAERVPEVAQEVAPVRREMESRLGPTLSRSRAAHILGVSQTALDRWVAARQVPVVITPRGRKEVPRQFVIEVREAIDELIREGRRGRLLARALKRRSEAAAGIGSGEPTRSADTAAASDGHRTAERRALANHALIAERLDEGMIEAARETVDRLASEGRLHPRYTERWRLLLSRPRAEIARALAADTEEDRDLRQNSPFAGVLNEQERRRVIETVR